MSDNDSALLTDEEERIAMKLASKIYQESNTITEISAYLKACEIVRSERKEKMNEIEKELSSIIIQPIIKTESESDKLNRLVSELTKFDKWEEVFMCVASNKFNGTESNNFTGMPYKAVEFEDGFVKCRLESKG
jgi:hypothetical protein